MATASQRQRKLARARYHQHQSKVKRQEQAKLQRQAAAHHRAKTVPVDRQRTIVVDDVPNRSDLERMAVTALRALARSAGVKRTSIMRKAALVDAILAARS